MMTIPYNIKCCSLNNVSLFVIVNDKFSQIVIQN